MRGAAIGRTPRRSCALLVLWAGWRLLRDTTHVLMEGTPRGMDVDTVCKAMLDIEGVVDVHHLHLWNLAADVPALSAHVVAAGEPTLRDAQGTADRIRATLGEQFGLTHLTLKLECTSLTEAVPTTPCDDPEDPPQAARQPTGRGGPP